MLSLEANLFNLVGAALKAKGHDVRSVNGGSVGGYQGILFTRDPGLPAPIFDRRSRHRRSAGQRRVPRRLGSSQGRSGGRLVMNRQPWFVTIVFVCVMAGLAGRAHAEDRITPGELVVDHPTLINLGFEWLVQGDDNRNAQVAVSYRQQGESQWKQALPLLRLQGERIYQENSCGCRLAEHVRRQHPRPGAGHGVRGAVRDVRSRRLRRTDEAPRPRR